MTNVKRKVFNPVVPPFHEAFESFQKVLITDPDFDFKIE
jgi:hypothetical protein